MPYKILRLEVRTHYHLSEQMPLIELENGEETVNDLHRSKYVGLHLKAPLSYTFLGINYHCHEDFVDEKPKEGKVTETCGNRLEVVN